MEECSAHLARSTSDGSADIWAQAVTCEMQMEERSAHLARSTSDGSEVLGTHLYMFYEVLKVWEAHWLWGDLGSYESKWRRIIWVQAVTMWDANGFKLITSTTHEQRWVGGLLVLLLLLLSLSSLSLLPNSLVQDEVSIGMVKRVV